MASQSISNHSRKIYLLAVAAGLVLAGPAMALDTISPSAVSAATGDCPVLTGIKYPWISCEANEHGGVTLALPSQPAPKACNLRLADGECAASPREWQLDMPVIGPGPDA
jgi:hypothetical protein